MFKSGFVSIIGRPNVGKSTLLNNFLGMKLAIVSPRAQTTRNRIQGIYTTETEQIIQQSLLKIIVLYSSYRYISTLIQSYSI